MHHFFRFLFQLGYLGPFVMGVLDSSFLFLPFGNDLLVVALTARHHQRYLLYVAMAVAGSTLGVLLITWAARKLGEAGITRMAGERRFSYLKGKIEKRGAVVLALGCLAPPPFPFTMVVAVTSALGYSRPKLLATVGISRAVRFLILGYLAILYGRWIIHAIGTPAFKWTVIAFAGLCTVGSVLSILKWFRSRPAEA
jgi:membrane protein YqaA with SNARE-associated domain